MQAKFIFSQCSSDGNKVKHAPEYSFVFDSLDTCFDFLAAQGHRIESAELIHLLAIPDRQIGGVKPMRNLSVMYCDTLDDSLQKALKNTQILTDVFFYSILQIEGCKVSFSEFMRIRNKWSNWNIARKVFHPGNSLTLAFLLIGVGLALGAACPPALIFVALGVAAFSAVSALVYGARWLSRDYEFHKAKLAAQDHPTQPSILNHLREYPKRLKEWAKEHKGPSIVMGIGFALFVTGLVVTALAFTAGLAAVPILAGVIGGMGVSGTALGAVGAVFGGALGSSAIATTLASIFAGATLILAPVNILDTIWRFFSGVYENKDFLTVVPPHVVHDLTPQPTTINPELVAKKPESVEGKGCIRVLPGKDNTQKSSGKDDAQFLVG